MFATLTDTPGAVAAGTLGPALKVVEEYCHGTAAVTAEVAMKLILMTGKALSGKTLGIVGFGQAGRELASKAHHGFGMKILVHNRSTLSDDDLGQFDARQVDDIDHLLGQSDIVSLHCPDGAENRHLIDALRLNRMKPDACLINVAGRELVDEEALADALWYDTIAGAGLDMAPGKRAVCDRLLGCENLAVLHPAASPPQPSSMAT